MRVLAIDVSALAASAALMQDGKLLGEFFLNVGLTHSTTLMPMIEQLLRYAGVGANDVDLFAVTNGPGSFTGVRIGVATVKGMAMAADKPCVGVSSLEAMAYNLPFCPSIVCCAMDARRDQVYTALFRAGGGRMERLLPDSAMAVGELGALLQTYDCPVTFLGDGAQLCFDRLCRMCRSRRAICVFRVRAAQRRRQCSAGIRRVLPRNYRYHISVSRRRSGKE